MSGIKIKGVEYKICTGAVIDRDMGRLMAFSEKYAVQKQFVEVEKRMSESGVMFNGWFFSMTVVDFPELEKSLEACCVDFRIYENDFFT